MTTALRQGKLSSILYHSELCRKKCGVICRRTPHFVERSSACLREKLRKEDWSQNVKMQNLPMSKLQKQACNSAAAWETNGVTDFFQVNNIHVLQLLTTKILLRKENLKMNFYSFKSNTNARTTTKTNRRVIIQWLKTKQKLKPLC